MPADYEPFDKQEWLRLEKKANDLRHLTVKTVAWGGSGHIGGGMSALDALTILYHRFMKLDPNDPDWPDRDRFSSRRAMQPSRMPRSSWISATCRRRSCTSST